MMVPLIVRGTKTSPQWDLAHLTSATPIFLERMISIQTVPEELKKKGRWGTHYAGIRELSAPPARLLWCKIWPCLCPIIKGYKYTVSSQYSGLLCHPAFLCFPFLLCILPAVSPNHLIPIQFLETCVSLFVYTSFSIDEISINLVCAGQEQRQQQDLHRLVAAPK